MKAWKICILIGCLGSILSCMMYTGSGPSSYIGHPYANSSDQDEIIITDELKELISSNPKLKIVIRIAQPSQSVTRAERVISDVNIFEKTLVRNSYIVRDRALLENLMKSESADYLSIKDKIDTDIIIEILRIEFGIPNQEKSYFNVTTNQVEDFPIEENYIDCPMAKLECRITLVDRGQLGGMFLFHITRCDLEKREIILNRSRTLMGWVEKETGPAFLVLTMSLDDEEVRERIIEYFANRLIQILS